MGDGVENSAVALEPVGPYALLARLPPDGSAEVFVARREDASNPVILKRLGAAHRGKPVEENRFAREAEVTMCLDHPNLVVGIDRGQADGVAYVVTELVVGYTLRTVLSALHKRNEGLPFQHFITVADAVLRGLHHAHGATDASGRSLGIVHRDLSPDNILVTPGGDVRIRDFALARARAGEFKTAIGISVGNAPYLSPEQARGYPLDGRSDLYTLGVTFYELLTGRPVVAAKDLVQAIRAVLEKDPPSLRFERADIPPAVDEVIRTATRKSARDRYKNAEAMRTALMATAGRKAAADPPALGRFLRSILPEDEARVSGFLDAARGKSLGLSDWTDQADRTALDLEPYGATEASNPPRRFAWGRTVLRTVATTAQAFWSALQRGLENARDGIHRARSAAMVALVLTGVAGAFVAGRLTAPAHIIVQNPPSAPPPPAIPALPRPGPAQPTPPEAVSDAPTLQSASPPPVAAAAPAAPVDEAPIFELQDPRDKMTREALFEQLAAIRDEEEYRQAFARLHAALFARAGRLPADQRAAVLADLEAAKRDLDVERLARVMSRLPKGRLWPP